MDIDKIYRLFLKNPSVVTDSRKIQPGDIFFALKGPSFNGNEFALQAQLNGAAYSIIDEQEFLQEGNDKIILVEDCLKTLQDLARHHRSKLQIPIIGITGSNGKTTSKELLSEVLSSQYTSFATQGNFNNHIGVPLSVLSIKSEHEIAIIEMGANHVGEIAFLSEICRPTHGFITNIGKAHLEGFGSVEGVKKAKSELYQFLEKNNGIAFINSNESALMELIKKFRVLKIYYGAVRSSIEDFHFTVLSEDPFLNIEFGIGKEKFEVSTHLSGKHNFQNLISAAFLGFYFKVPKEKIASAIAGYASTNNRSQIVSKGVNKFYLDAYNANPTSMRAAINAFVSLARNDQKIAILGDMFELGKYSKEEHKALISFSLKQNFETVIFVGKIFYELKEDSAFYFIDVSALKQWFEKENFQNKFFLVKGSRGIKLEKLLD